MSDGRLRDAERRWRESGRLDDRVRWWSERARVGELPVGTEVLILAVSEGGIDVAAIELAAYLGDPRAQALALEEVVERITYSDEDRVLAAVFDEPTLDLQGVLAWISALRVFDRQAVPRALAAATAYLAARLAASEPTSEPPPHEP